MIQRVIFKKYYYLNNNNNEGLDSITDSTDRNLNKLQETAKDSEAQRAAVHQIGKRWTGLCDCLENIPPGTVDLY